MIDRIYTFGTSCTAGGGFEFDCNYKHRDLRGSITKKNRGEFIKSIYNEKPYTQNHYSYPGQLQKLLNESESNIEVINISKQGYGNERIYRKFYDLLKKGKLENKNNCLFIFEFSDLSRKEFWHNPSNNHLIMNYLADDEITKDCSIVKSYFYDDKKDRQLYNKDYNLFKTFREEFIEVDNESQEVTRSLLLFLEYLKHNNFNFLISSMPELIHPKYYDEVIKYENYCISFGFDGGTIYKSFHRFQDLEYLKISDETKGAYRDTHGGLFSNKVVSKNIFNEMIKRKYIEKERIEIPKIIDFKSLLNKNKLI